jgi:hypothetical protein
MQGTFNREVVFDMDDEIEICQNYVTRKQIQLILIPPSALLGLCK